MWRNVPVPSRHPVPARLHLIGYGHHRRNMAPNSFSSVSLPPPLVLWSLSNTSRRHDAFAQAQHYSIHVLADAQADMALHFAANGEGFDAYPHDIDAQGVPLLHGCLARFDCTHHASHPAGDHSIILGRVTQVATRATGAGLAFDQGQYGRFQPF